MVDDLLLSPEDEARIRDLRDEIPRDRAALAGPTAALRAKQKELTGLLARKKTLSNA
jgi:hypothetical protein